jgi:glycine cleavage system H protein
VQIQQMAGWMKLSGKKDPAPGTLWKVLQQVSAADTDGASAYYPGANLSGIRQGRTQSTRAPFIIPNLNEGGITMNVPSNLRYTENDEWLKLEGNSGTIGITDFAQNQLSDIVYVEVVVSPGDKINKGDTIATLESVKAAADVYSPVSGEITAINEDLPDTPELVNSDPYGAAWLVKLNLSDTTEPGKLLDAGAYEQKIQAQE